MTSPIREGDILAGKYKVERVLAQGGMGIVVAAIHQQLEQRVALKFMLPEGMENEGALSRFLREAKAAVRLRSEHVARVLDVGTAETGSPYIVMEYLEGLDLSGVISEQGALPMDLAITYVLQAAEAVAEAHALGIVHRDLKPANLFLTKRADGTPCVKVLDFGISKLTGVGDMNLTKTNTVMGTPFYMAPEQLQSSKNVDLRSDVWSLGMILYELLTGVVAFQRDTLPGLCSAILFEPVPSARERVPAIPEGVEAVLFKALEKLPGDRYQTLGEFADALAPFLSTGVMLAERVSRVLGLAAAAHEARTRVHSSPMIDRDVAVERPSLAATSPKPFGPSAPSSTVGPSAPSAPVMEHLAATSEEPTPSYMPVSRPWGKLAAVGGVVLVCLVVFVVAMRSSRREEPARASASSQVAAVTPPGNAEGTMPKQALLVAPTQTSQVIDTAGSSAGASLASAHVVAKERPRQVTAAPKPISLAPSASPPGDDMYGPRK